MADDKRNPTPIAAALESYLKRCGFSRRLEQVEVVEAWPTFVGPQIAAVTTAESVSAEGVLRVRVTTAAWANELSMMVPQILARVNAGRKGRIKEIRWLPGGSARHQP
ncbi:MAG: DUF721 domain-containing protein [Gemmatimonadota bacterium]